MTEDTAVKSSSKPAGDGLGSGLMKRRGLFAAAWAAVAALVLKKSEQTVQADGTQGTPLTIGVLNTETAPTNLKWAGTPATSSVMLVANDSFYSPSGASFGAAVAGWAAGTGGTDVTRPSPYRPARAMARGPNPDTYIGMAGSKRTKP